MGPVEERLDTALTCLMVGWTKNTLARDVFGNDVDPGDERACKWCAIGALYEAAAEPDTFDEDHDDVHKQALHLLAEVSGIRIRKSYLVASLRDDVADFNDAQIENQAGAIAWFQKAKNIAQERGL